jgi:hypothetical protein
VQRIVIELKDDDVTTAEIADLARQVKETIATEASPRARSTRHATRNPPTVPDPRPIQPDAGCYRITRVRRSLRALEYAVCLCTQYRYQSCSGPPLQVHWMAWAPLAVLPPPSTDRLAQRSLLALAIHRDEDTNTADPACPVDGDQAETDLTGAARRPRTR